MTLSSGEIPRTQRMGRSLSRKWTLCMIFFGEDSDPFYEENKAVFVDFYLLGFGYRISRP